MAIDMLTWVDNRGSEILDTPECLRLVAAGAEQGLTGRLAVARGGSPTVLPVNFTFGDGSVYVRLGEGSLAAAITNAPVAFEVDEVDDETKVGWSVLIRGHAQPVEPTDGESPVEGMVARVPVPGHQVFSVQPDIVTGRRFRYS